MATHTHELGTSTGVWAGRACSSPFASSIRWQRLSLPRIVFVLLLFPTLLLRKIASHFLQRPLASSPVTQSFNRSIADGETATALTGVVAYMPLYGYVLAVQSVIVRVRVYFMALACVWVLHRWSGWKSRRRSRERLACRCNSAEGFHYLIKYVLAMGRNLKGSV